MQGLLTHEYIMITKNLIRKTIKQANVSFIYLQFSDLLGHPKNVSIDVDKLDDILDSGLWFDGSSIEGFARIAESDMLLKPDFNTFAIIPWGNSGTKKVRLICDAFLPSGEPLDADPRHILKKVLQKTAPFGFDFYTGAEFEFYLLERHNLPDLHPHDTKSYFDYHPNSRAINICESTMQALSAFGIKSEMHHHEVGQGQHEIDIRFDTALKSADNVLSLKMALKAHSSGTELKATWMPKPISGFPGNGLHVHQSLWKNGKNAFSYPKNKHRLSELAFHFLAGQLAHAKALSAIVSPTVNSYKRLVSGFEAPVYICWGETNRSALIRIPHSPIRKASQAARLEYRAGDPSANPYLVFASLLAAGLDGIERKLEPPKLVEENVYEFKSDKLLKKHISTLPSDLREAVSELEKDPVILDIFGTAKEKYLQIKKEEWQQFSSQVTPWEIKRYI